MDGFPARVRRWGVGLLVFAILNGCSNSDNNQAEPDKSNIEIRTPSPTATPIPSPSPTLAAMTYKNVKTALSMDMTKEEVDNVFGHSYEVQASSLYLHSDWVPVELWTYSEGDKTSMQLFWSQDQRLLYAVFYDQDEQGNRRSYIPSVGALASSSSEDNLLAAKYGIRVGQELSVAESAAGYDMLSSSMPILSYLAVPSRPVTVTAINETFAEIDDDGVRSWIPIWYLTKEAADVQDIEPLELTVNQDGQAYWYPGSQLAVMPIQKNETVYAFRSFGDWYGVTATASTSDHRSNAGLMWIRKDQASSSGKAWLPIYAYKMISSDSVAAVVRSEIVLGATARRIERILGKPQFIERSDNIEQPGKLKTLQVWRYENATSELVLTWSDQQTLLNYRYRDRSGEINFGNGNQYNFEQPARILSIADKDVPVVASAKVTYDWRTKTELPYNYLIREAGNTLLVAGEDNGFSGFHEASHLYGLNRDTGKEVWKYDFGYGMHLYAFSPENNAIVFYRMFENEVDSSRYELLAIDTRTGNKLWGKTFKVDSAIDDQSYSVSGKVAVLAYVQKIGEDQATTRLEARDIRSGRLLWNKKIEGSARLVEQNSQLPVIAIQTGNQMLIDSRITALDPQTGGIKWELKERTTYLASDNLLTVDNRFPQNELTGYWTRSDDRLILVDAKSGRSKLELPITYEYGTHYDGINDRYMFRQQALDGEKLYDSQDISTSLIDLRSGKAVWSVKGKADRGLLRNGRLFYCLDGKPRAVNLSDGKIIWETEFAVRGMMELYRNELLVEGVPDVYIVDGETGRVENRLHDVRIGYHEVTPNDQIYGVLTVLDGKLYVGSSNGYFGRMR
ncbi:outer membrane protein assembly factor BamB family protein [Cohnella mopanensis]|uniref:outer membrane protein assembly factor BamB family protein n=1 Tax=Cohnella mopanensis TaxID=2911966 RepID=UPI001EF7CAAE|nr:PQQ-binding-like beta-propeller repeat protein [Cohnella mopanensis]